MRQRTTKKRAPSQNGAGQPRPPLWSDDQFFGHSTCLPPSRDARVSAVMLSAHCLTTVA